MALPSSHSRSVAADMLAQTREQERAQKRAQAADAAVERLFGTSDESSKSEKRASKPIPSTDTDETTSSPAESTASVPVKKAGRGRPSQVSGLDIRAINLRIPTKVLEALDEEIKTRSDAGEQGVSRTSVISEELMERYGM